MPIGGAEDQGRQCENCGRRSKGRRFCGVCYLKRKGDMNVSGYLTRVPKDRPRKTRDEIGDMFCDASPSFEDAAKIVEDGA